LGKFFLPCADAFSFWTFWKSYGTKGIGKFVDKMMQLRTEAVEWIKKNPRLKIIGDPEYLNICVEILPP
jgi:glutamate/tyrosine decarboxylase-like PLP-dependent enzyme